MRCTRIECSVAKRTVVVGSRVEFSKDTGPLASVSRKAIGGKIACPFENRAGRVDVQVVQSLVVIAVCRLHGHQAAAQLVEIVACKQCQGSEPRIEKDRGVAPEKM
jgi:hypothetical protein